MKLGLGTVQFGLDYGISNRSGKTAVEEVKRILAFASASQIRLLDSASSYGDSESVLGQVIPSDGSFQIVTKTPKITTDSISAVEIKLLHEKFQESLAKLKQKKIYGLLIHSSDELSKPGADTLIAALKDLVRQGLVEKIGVSVYTAQQIEHSLTIFQPEIVQLPINIFDQRLIQNKVLKRLKERSIEIHARSIFLQGLLLMEKSQASERFPEMNEHFERFCTFLKEKQLSALQAALIFARQIEEIDRILVGVTSLNELMQIIDAYTHLPSSRMNFESLAVADERLLSPQQWSTRPK